jgi:deoxyribodipyrimidine photo-lyase
VILKRFHDSYAQEGLRPARLLLGLTESEHPAFHSSANVPSEKRRGDVGAGGFRVVPLQEGADTPQGRLWTSFLLGKSPLQSTPAANEGSGAYVVYWMTQGRRLQHNAALAAAMLLSKESGKPLLVVESLTSNYPWASERHHAFVADGVAERLGLVSGIPPAPGYLFVGIGGVRVAPHTAPTEPLALPLLGSFVDVAFAEGSRPANAGVLPALFREAACVVSDWAPWFLFPHLAARTHATLTKQGKPFLLVDDCGLVPLASHVKVEAAARFLRPKLVPYVSDAARETEATERIAASFSAWAKKVPHDTVVGVASGIAPVDESFLRGSAWRKVPGPVPSQPSQPSQEVDAFVEALCAFARVPRVPARTPLRGGEGAAHTLFAAFVKKGLARYDEDRNHPDLDGTSRMSAYLHFGMVHPRALLAAVEKSAGQALSTLPKEVSAAKYVDELVTWRELGLNMARFAFEAGTPLGSLELVPGWAVKTLREHMGKKEAPLPLADLEAARTPDPVWNAAQRELVATGQLHNYMRMLWGKGIVAWSATPEEALARLVHLNNAYALDGRDPNSYTGIYWCLGKFDRPWPPARPPFGITRSMSTKNARKKLAMERYLARHGKL